MILNMQMLLDRHFLYAVEKTSFHRFAIAAAFQSTENAAMDAARAGCHQTMPSRCIYRHGLKLDNAMRTPAGFDYPDAENEPVLPMSHSASTKASDRDTAASADMAWALSPEFTRHRFDALFTTIRMADLLLLGAAVMSWIVAITTSLPSSLAIAVACTVLVTPVLLAGTLPPGFAANRRRRAAVMDVPDAATQRQAEHDGRIALARIVSITETSGGFDYQKICVIRVLVVPSDASAYETSVRRLVSPIDAPRLQPGCVVVTMAAIDRSRLWILLDPLPGWLDRASTDAPVRTIRSAPEFSPVRMVATSAGRRRMRFLLRVLVPPGAGAALGLLPLLHH